jgi:hypothetical protein
MHKGRPMTKVITTTFLVSDVEPATTVLQEVPYKEAVKPYSEQRLRTAASDRWKPAPVTMDNSLLGFRSTQLSPPHTERSWITAPCASHRISSGC